MVLPTRFALSSRPAYELDCVGYTSLAGIVPWLQLNICRTSNVKLNIVVISISQSEC